MFHYTVLWQSTKDFLNLDITVFRFSFFISMNPQQSKTEYGAAKNWYVNCISIIIYRSMNLPLNDPSHMTVETIKRVCDNTSLFKFSHVQQLYLNPVEEDTPDEQGQKSVDSPSSSKRRQCNTCPVSFPMRPNIKKTAYKISTPPIMFFRKLNFLLRNLHQIKYFAFARFTLTNAFVGKFLMNVDQVKYFL